MAHIIGLFALVLLAAAVFFLAHSLGLIREDDGSYTARSPKKAVVFGFVVAALSVIVFKTLT